MARPSLSEASLSQRQRLNALQRFRQPDDPDITEARRDLVALTLEDHIRQVVDAAPALTVEQRAKVAALLLSGSGRDGPHSERRSGGASQQPDLGANQEGHNPSDYLSVPVLARQAALIVAEKNLPISGSRVRKLVRRFVREGRTDIDFRTWLICYADPTGETAVRNVMRGADR